jgi:hypothetical protein
MVEFAGQPLSLKYNTTNTAQMSKRIQPLENNILSAGHFTYARVDEHRDHAARRQRTLARNELPTTLRELMAMVPAATMG